MDGNGRFLFQRGIKRAGATDKTAAEVEAEPPHHRFTL